MPENSHDTSGTPGYMAPEVMCRQNHGVAADYFAVGVIAYECMLGRRPYQGKSRREIRDQILAKQVVVKFQDLPRGWSLEAADFINRVKCLVLFQLLQRKPSSRLGLNGPSEVKNHPWLKGISWDDLCEHKLIAPYIPKVKLTLSLQANADNFDAKYANDIKKDMDDAALQSIIKLKEVEVQAQFANYYYDYENRTESVRYTSKLEDKETKKEPNNVFSTADVHMSSI